MPDDNRFIIFVTNRLLNYMRRDVFQAISDPTRREIIQLLASETMNLNAVAAKFEISRPAISKHIKILAECGLISIQAEGRERFCQANLADLKKVADWTSSYKRFWESKLDALELHLSNDKTEDKTDAH